MLTLGDQSIYLGLEAGRFDDLSTSTGSFDTDSLIGVDDGVTSFGAKAIFTYGLHDRVEAEVRLPWYLVYANRPGAVCDLLTTEALDTCAVNSGLGVIEARTKVLLVDELAGAPLSVSASADARLGMFTQAERGQITNLGEGTFDLGATLMAGRSGGLFGGVYTVFLEAGWRYRFPQTDSYENPDDETDSPLVAPSWETHGVVDVLVSPGAGFYLGPEVAWLWRPLGNDVEDLLGYASDIDRFSALRIANVTVGGKVIVAAGEQVNLSASVLHSLWTMNNPSVTTFSAGLSIREIFRRRPAP